MLDVLIIYMSVFVTYMHVMRWLNATRKKAEKPLGWGAILIIEVGEKETLLKLSHLWSTDA